jgi:predicted nucleic acid-binding protein
MAMKTYLFDASAAVELYLPGDRRVKRVVSFIREQKTRFQEAMLYIPSFCIAEVLNTLARKHFRPTIKDEPLTQASYNECLKRFRDDVHWGKTFYPYELHRYHIIAADRIIPIEHHFALKDDFRHLSTFDILIIAMSCELSYTGIREETYLVTGDKRIKDIVDKFRRVDLNELKLKTPSGPLGEIEKRRWIPPECIDVVKICLDDLKKLKLNEQDHIRL